MKLPRLVKPSKALSRDDMRPVLTGAMVREEEVPIPADRQGPSGPTTQTHLILYGTDSYVFVRIDLGAPDHDGTEENRPGPIPAVALKHMERGVNAILDEKEIVAGITRYDRVIAEDWGQTPGDEINFPEYDKLVPDFSKKTFRLGINPRLLMNIAEALGCGPREILYLDFDRAKFEGPEGGEVHYHTVFKVSTPRTSGQAEGLMMPVRVGGE